MKAETSTIVIEKTDIDAITKAKIERVARSCGCTFGDYIAGIIEKKTKSLPS